MALRINGLEQPATDTLTTVETIDGKVDTIDANVDTALVNQTNIEAKIDTIDTNVDSALTETETVEEHLHNRERWFGKSADQSGDDWAVEAGLTVFQAISGNADFGTDPNDEAKVLGTDDTPVIAGQTTFDFHRIMVDAASNANPYVLRIVYGTGTMADAETAGQYTDMMITEARKGGPVPAIMLRIAVGTKVWMRAKNGTDDATINFFVGVHGYPA